MFNMYMADGERNTLSLKLAMASLERLSSKEFTKKSASNKILWSCEVTFV